MRSLGIELNAMELGTRRLEVVRPLKGIWDGHGMWSSGLGLERGQNKP